MQAARGNEGKTRMAPASIKETVRQRGIRMTKQRQILLDLIDESGRHLDAEKLYELAVQKDPKLNRVTVYRTIKMLKDAQLIDELDLMHWSGDQHYYETRLKQEHAHVVCLSCGKVQEYFGPPVGRLRRQVESTLGFKVVTVRTEIGGYCPECQSRIPKEELAEPARAGSAVANPAGAAQS